MKQTLIRVTSLLIILSTISCSQNLIPAWRSNTNTSVSITFNTLPSTIHATESSAERAIIQGGGYLYIQTGVSSSQAKIYGPYRILPGDTLNTEDIPPGKYPFLALLYGEEKTANKKPATVETTANIDSNFKSALLAASASPYTTSYSLLKNIEITEGRGNAIAATLIPLTEEVLNASYSADTISFDLPDTKGIKARKFILIDQAAVGIPSGTTVDALILSARNGGTAEALFQRLDIYRTDGTVHTANPTAAQTLAGETKAEIWQVAFNESAQFFLYIEYTGTNMILDLDYTPDIVPVAVPVITVMAASIDGTVRTSQDGINWQGPYSTGLSPLNALVYGGSGLFVAGGIEGSYYAVKTSSDGVTWTTQALPGAVQTKIISMASNPAGQIVAISNTGATNQSYASSDGITWSGPGSVPYNSTNPTWHAGKWYITNSNGSTWLSSTDGVTWNSVTASGSGMYSLLAIAGVNGNLIAGGGAAANATKQVQISTNNGTSFGALISVNSATNYITAFTVTDTNRLISAGSGTTKQINWSDDSGNNWTSAIFAPTDYINSICWTPLGIFAGTSGATIYRSTDNGANFAISGPASAAVTGIAFKTAP